MPRHRTTASRWAAVASVGLSVVLVQQASGATSTSAKVLGAAVALLAAVGGAKMLLHNCFESHLVVIVAVTATVIGTVLSLLLGMPGSAPTEPSPTHVLILLLSAAIAGLLVLDARVRGSEH